MFNNDIFSQIFFGIVSFVSNFISALSGGGAGLIQLPALLLFGLPFSKALATHKVASVALGVGASIPHLKQGNLQRKYALLILISGIPGVLSGAYIASIIPSNLSTSLLGFLTLFISFYSVNNKKLGNSNSSTSNYKLRIIIGSLGLFVIGFLNGYLSSGTGLFVTIWMITIFNLSFTVAVAYTLIFVGIFWNGVGALSLGLRGNIIWNYIPILILGSLVGGYFGAYFSIVKGSKFVKLFFEIITFSVGISLLIKAFL
ncbi:sulfite exporter TauE/SafE family protein [Prochlorococcus marinus]|uniref:Probable membrane transporter protein n=1 Tax=Prochlorococcus marinus XMU1408 TaxID=2213228 RepID=A0A318R0E1_PROMR|nr:sulfite exporter TauE/SafE family protein [Prochlorococcus marinus]MBW3041873.1 permease [Prochlorococcus marinus str. XMU1408]PYE03007.1 permease [Prochlorococcus marinus XMU1408]